MKERCERPRRSRRGLACALGLALGLTGGTASAQVTVYHSPQNDGQNPNQPLELPVGPNTDLNLFLDAGSQSSQQGAPCDDGNGRELCGYEVRVTAHGGTVLTNFFPEPGVVHRVTPLELEANGLFALDPALGPVRIGTLRVSASEPGGEVMLEGGVAILAALQSETVPQAVMASAPVPEPSRWQLWIAGVGLLAALQRRRRLLLAGRPAGRGR